MPKPSVSVVLPCHNRASMLGRSVPSILAQSVRDFELIIVDDGSRDDTAEVLRGFADPRIRVASLGANRGVAVARNVGIGLAAGRYMAVMDSDDEAEPHRLERQLACMEETPGVDILGSNLVKIAGGEEIPMTHDPRDGVIKARLLTVSGAAMIHPTSFVRMSFLKRHGLRYPIVRTDEDHAFWLEAMLRGATFSVHGDSLLRYHRHGGNLTSRTDPGRADHLRRKTALRQRMLAAFFPRLATAETWRLARLMEEGRPQTAASVRAGLGVISRALTDGRSRHGESKPEVFRILRAYEASALHALATLGGGAEGASWPTSRTPPA